MSGIIILAAGASTRLGRPKQLLQYQAQSLLHHTSTVAIASGCQPIIVVLGAYASRIEPEVVSLPVHIIENEHWATGMSSSIRMGLSTLKSIQPTLEAAVMLLCDQPLISASLIQELIDTYHRTGKPIVASDYAGIMGVPALFSQAFFSELMTLEADKGARQIIQRYGNEVACVPFPQGAIDIDTPEDYEHFLQTTAYSDFICDTR
jgi:molybdenum cofactor cytidylyltransferase